MAHNQYHIAHSGIEGEAPNGPWGDSASPDSTSPPAPAQAQTFRQFVLGGLLKLAHLSLEYGPQTIQEEAM